MVGASVLLAVVGRLTLGWAIGVAWRPGVALAAVGFVLSRIARAMPRRTPAGALDAARWRWRWRVEQALEKLLKGHDLDHLDGYRLRPNLVAVGFRLLARNQALGCQIAQHSARTLHLLETRAFRAAHMDGLGTFSVERRTIHLHPLHASSASACVCPGPATSFNSQHELKRPDLRLA